MTQSYKGNGQHDVSVQQHARHWKHHFQVTVSLDRIHVTMLTELQGPRPQRAVPTAVGNDGTAVYADGNVNHWQV